MKDKKIFVLLLILILVLGLIFFLKPQPKTPSPSVSQTPNIPAFKAYIAITNTGFVPATLLIKANTEVVWRNTDSKEHQIVSDTLPIAKDSSYSFVFTKPGTYTYHDKLDPARFKGTIVVR